MGEVKFKYIVRACIEHLYISLMSMIQKLLLMFYHAYQIISVHFYIYIIIRYFFIFTDKFACCIIFRNIFVGILQRQFLELRQYHTETVKYLIGKCSASTVSYHLNSLFMRIRFLIRSAAGQGIITICQ